MLTSESSLTLSAHCVTCCGPGIGRVHSSGMRGKVPLGERPDVPPSNKIDTDGRRWGVERIIISSYHGRPRHLGIAMASINAGIILLLLPLLATPGQETETIKFQISDECTLGKAKYANSSDECTLGKAKYANSSDECTLGKAKYANSLDECTLGKA
uniref:(California timema) hypothetical protein n=1 Tax=Timema californicum TaxID=61474 RepID=A0A7R9IVW4_TIMCA|nr:unnamed protein product [Timema californicum]